MVGRAICDAPAWVVKYNTYERGPASMGGAGISRGAIVNQSCM